MRFSSSAAYSSTDEKITIPRENIIQESPTTLRLIIPQNLTQERYYRLHPSADLLERTDLATTSGPILSGNSHPWLYFKTGILSLPGKPSIVSFSPIDGATNVSSGSNITIAFNEYIFPGTGKINLRKLSDNSLVESFDPTDSTKVTFSNQSLILNPDNDLDGLESFYLDIEQNAVKDLSDEPITAISNTSSLPSSNSS